MDTHVREQSAEDAGMCKHRQVHVEADRERLKLLFSGNNNKENKMYCSF